MASSSLRQWPLHCAVFEGDHDNVKQLVESGADLSAVDPHGSTALHIAVSIGCEWCSKILVEHDAPVGLKNHAGWHSLHEAVSFGHRPTITRLLMKLKEQARLKTEVERPVKLQIVGQLPDFQVTVNWEFSSWVPFVNRILPYDVCKLYKKGSRLRVESTLIDFQDSHWQHGDVTFLFNKDGLYDRSAIRRPVDQDTTAEQPSPTASADSQPIEAEAKAANGDDSLYDSFLVILDNRRRQFQRLRKRDTAKEIEDEVSALMSSDIVNARLLFDGSRLERERRTPATIFSAGSFRRVTVGEFEADCFEIHGLVIEARKRREHLSDVEVRHNKELLARLHQHGDVSKVKQMVRHKLSLESPMRTIFDFGEYLDAATGSTSRAAAGSLHDLAKASAGSFSRTRSVRKHEHAIALGRTRKEKVQRKHVHARVAMSTDFPLSVPEFVLVLDVVAPYKKFNRLREFMLHKLPAGFPVKLDVPVYPTVNAKVVFSDFAFESDKPIADSLFEIPQGYTENPRLFPGI